MSGFWDKLPRPFFCLAPMEDVTDTVFRQVLISAGRPDVYFTEFTNVNGLCSEGFDKVAQRLLFTEQERPIVAQIWGVEPELFYQAARKIKEMGFDGIDINLGCPVREVVKMGACAAMIGKNSQVAEIVEATKKAGLPVGVKTRIGNKKIMTEDWIGFLLTLGLSAITVHGRTAAEKSDVPAHWDEIGKAAILAHLRSGRARMPRSVPGISALANPVNVPGALIIGNGGVDSLQDARFKVQKYGVDGVMIGRGIFRNPWIFSEKTGSKKERLELLTRHIKLWQKTWGNKKHFPVMKKFVKMYISGWEGAGELREKMMQSQTGDQLLSLVCSYQT